MITLEFLRQFRIGQYAIFDLSVTFLAIYLISPLLSKMFQKIRVAIPKKNWLFLALPIGILTHLVVGKITPMTSNFIDIQGHYILKIFILILLILGLRNIRIVKKSS